MRVCFITNLYPPHAKGGAERVVSEEARALKEAGHDVIVITAMPLPDDGDPGPAMKTEDGIRVHRFYPANLFFYGEIGRHGFVARAFFHLWDLIGSDAGRVVKKILEAERPEVVHTHNLKGIGYSVLRAIRKLGIRHVHTLHDVQLIEPSGLIIKGQEMHRPSVERVIGGYARLMAWVMGSPDTVISPSKFLIECYRSRGFFPKSRCFWLPNPAPETRASARRSSKETRFLFLGQVEPHKGVLMLIEAMKKLLAAGDQARLEIVGEGSAEKAAAALAGKELRIAFYGKKNPNKFAEMFAGTDYVVLPSLCYENAPTVIMESFAYGIPVLVADIGGAGELIKDGRNGWKFEAGSVESLLTIMKLALWEKSRWEELSHGARRSADLLTARHHADRLIKLYRGIDPGLISDEPVIPVRYFAKPASTAPRAEMTRPGHPARP
jgi:glycosyltransferase involved in cell wall biosynthesis